MLKRYEVHTVSKSPSGIGDLLRAFARYPDAERYAAKMNRTHLDGVLLRDTVTDIVDWGYWCTLGDAEGEVIYDARPEAVRKRLGEAMAKMAHDYLASLPPATMPRICNGNEFNR